MARLESEQKGGFYPTPSDEMALVIKRIRAEENGVTLLDPCAGEGWALKQVQDHLLKQDVKSTTFGIELERTRADKAEDVINNVINCGYEEARMSHNAFSFMYLNPPFAEFQGERLEKIFFRHLTRPNSYLTEGALVVLNMPQYVLNPMASLIAQRLENVKVYRFTDENFPSYKQVIVYGKRRKKGLGLDRSMREKLERLAFISPEHIPTLDVEDWDEVQYTIPAPKKEVALFDTSFVDVDDIIKSMNDVDVMGKVTEKVSNPKFMIANGKKPAMPLKVSHMATAIASGALPETMGDHLLVGITKTQVTETTDYDVETEREKETVTYQSKSLIRVFSDRGIFDLQ